MRPVRSCIRQRVSALKKFMVYRLSVISMLLLVTDGRDYIINMIDELILTPACM